LAVVAGLGVVAGPGRPARAADTPFAGTWKATAFFGGPDLTLALLKVEDQDGKPKASLLAGFPQIKDLALDDFKADAKSMRFTLKGGKGSLTFEATAYPAPKGAAKPKKLLGSVQFRGQYLPLQMEQTDLKELNAKNAQVISPGFLDLQKAAGEPDAKKQEAALKEVQEKFPGKPVALLAAQSLVDLKVRSEAAADELRAAADSSIKAAAAYGPELERNATYQAGRSLAPAKKGTELALDYARRAAKGLRDTDAPGTQTSVLKLLAWALRKAGKADEVKEIDARIAKLEDPLDQEFIKRAVPFKTEAYAGRKAKSDRVVVVELFTGAQCPPCVSADIAFDAALKTYRPTEVALLQYHLHIPLPDALTNADTEARSKYYGDEVEGTPTMFVDGKVTAPMGGPAQRGKESYDALREVIDKQLEGAAGAKLKLDVQRSGNQLALEARVSDLEKTGEKVRLRFVLVEDVVRYAGTNGQRLHHHVVRAFPGGAEGVALKEKTSMQSAKVALGDLAKGLDDYLTRYQAPRTKQRPFVGEDFPLNFEHLKVVALIQDDETKKILQASQVDVPPAK
jgi:hypothetical protein